MVSVKKFRKLLFIKSNNHLALHSVLESTVNSLVSDHPWCTTKWSLTGGGRLRERLTN